MAPLFAGRNAYRSVSVVRESNFVATGHYIDNVYEYVKDVNGRRLSEGNGDCDRITEYRSAGNGNDTCTSLISLVFVKLNVSNTIFNFVNSDPINIGRYSNALFVAGSNVRDTDGTTPLVYQE